MKNIIDLTKKAGYHRSSMKEFVKKTSLLSEFGKHKKGDIIEFWAGYNDDIRYRAEIIGFDKDGDIYLDWDAYWSPIRDEKRRNIKIIKTTNPMTTKTKSMNLATCSGSGRALKKSTSSGVRKAASKQLNTVCKGKSKTKTTDTMATKKKATPKKATPKQLAARKEFSANAKKAAKMVKDGKAKNIKAAWKKL